jgi:hypothetical protein
MCKKKRVHSLRSKLVVNIVPLFLIGEFAAMALIGALYVYNYVDWRDYTSKVT